MQITGASLAAKGAGVGEGDQMNHMNSAYLLKSVGRLIFPWEECLG